MRTNAATLVMAAVLGERILVPPNVEQPEPRWPRDPGCPVVEQFMG
jgi:hypothetical protein